MRAGIGMLLLGLAAAAAAAQDRAVIEVTTTPPNATIRLNGEVVGVAPAPVALPRGEGRVQLAAELPGYRPAERVIDLADAPASLELELALRRSRIPVTVANDPAPAPDGRISLREALIYARGERRPVGADKALIDGPVGEGRPDDIVIAVEGAGPSPVLTIAGPLPQLSDPGDALTGPEAQAALAPADEAELRGPGLILGPGTAVSNLVLDGFDIGLEARGFGTASADRLSAIGGAIGFSAAEAAELLLDRASASVSFAPVSATGGGIVDGVVERVMPESYEEAVLLSGPAGQPGYVTAVGWLPTWGETYLYARHAAPTPLSEVPGLDARSSSYEAYRIFGVEGYEHFPVYAVDGPDGNYFQWEFAGPPESEYLLVSAARPLRTRRLEVVHLEGDSRLRRYRLSLLDRQDRVLAEHEVTANPDRDVIELDPTIDFFAVRIDVVEAEGTTPGIREIEAEVLDSDAYRPISRSRRRIVFPRPPEGNRAAIEIAGQLVPLGDQGFAKRAVFAYEQHARPWQPQEPQSVALSEGTDAAALGAALAGLNPAWPAVLRLSGSIAIGGDFPPVEHPDLRLEGGALRMEPEARLRIEGPGRVVLAGMRLEGGGVVLGDSRDLHARDIDYTGFATAFEGGRYSDIVILDSRLAEGGVAVLNRLGSTTIAGSRISDVEVGVGGRASEAVVMLGTELDAAARLFELPAEGGRAGAMILIANEAEPAPALDRGAFPGDFSRESLLGDNRPAALGLPGEAFHVETRRWFGAATLDLRDGGEPTHARLVVAPDPELRCIALSEVRVPVVLPPLAVLVLHDAGMTLRCLSGATGAGVALPLAGTEGEEAGPPAAARLDLSLGESLAPDPAVFEAVEAYVAVGALGTGRPYPPRDAAARAERLERIAGSLVEGGDFPLAFARAMAELEANPRDRDAGRTVTYVADRWARALVETGETGKADRLLTDLADGREPPPGIVEALTGLLHDRAKAHLDAGEWEQARGLYRRILERRPGEEVASGNLLYAYQKAVSERLSPGTAAEIVDWIEGEAATNPALSPDIIEMAAVALNNATVSALDEGRYADALALARAQHRWQPSDRTLNNLQVAFQEHALDALARGAVDEALGTLAALSGEFGPEAGLGRIAYNVFGSEAQRAIEAGETNTAVSAARALHGAAPSAESAELLAYAYAQHGQALLEREGLRPAMEMLAGAVASHPDLTVLREQAAIIGNNAGVSHLNAEEFAQAVAAFELALEISPGDEGLRSNLRVAYVNWAITAANAGRLDEAREAAEAGLARYPGDADLTRAIEHLDSQ